MIAFCIGLETSGSLIFPLAQILKGMTWRSENKLVTLYSKGRTQFLFSFLKQHAPNNICMGRCGSQAGRLGMTESKSPRRCFQQSLFLFCFVFEGKKSVSTENILVFQLEWQPLVWNSYSFNLRPNVFKWYLFFSPLFLILLEIFTI